MGPLELREKPFILHYQLFTGGAEMPIHAFPTCLLMHS